MPRLDPIVSLLPRGSFALFALWSAAAAWAEAARPNILLILSDDHSAPHLGCYGDPDARTPNLDAFAAEGMRFNRAYTTAPQCAPSRASIYTGRSPIAIGSSRFPLPPRREHVFFTDVLRQHGYWVGLDGRHHHLAGRRLGEPAEEEGLKAAGLKYLEVRFDHVDIHGTGSDPSKSFNAVLDRIPKEKPFFLYFGFNQPHRRYRSQADDKVTMFDPARLRLPPDYPDLPEVREDFANFFYTVSILDRGFGGIMKVLQERGLAGNTIVAFMGDNGESLLRGKGTLYERGCHVPLLVRWPGVVKPGAVSDVLVSGEDLAGTFLEAAGLQVPREMTGVSFLPALQGKSYAGREYVFTERSWHWGPITRTDGLDLSRAIASQRYRLIFHALPDRAYTPVDLVNDKAWHAIAQANAAGKLSALHRRLLFQVPRPTIELFDLQADPYELENLAGRPDLKDIETKLRRELGIWMVREGDYLPIPSLTYPRDDSGGEKR
ncbi:MAG: sulfatase [Verrucomicrobia bacterium]|nr:sulfatase [Verrucomicrobiota bacterium]